MRLLVCVRSVTDRRSRPEDVTWTRDVRELFDPDQVDLGGIPSSVAQELVKEDICFILGGVVCGLG